MTAAQDIRRIADAIEHIASALTPPQGPVVPPPLPQASSDPSSLAPAEPALVELDRIEAQRDVISAAIAWYTAKSAYFDGGSQITYGEAIGALEGVVAALVRLDAIKEESRG